MPPRGMHKCLVHNTGTAFEIYGSSGLNTRGRKDKYLKLININLQECNIWKLLAEIVQFGRKHFAGPTPFSKEVHNHLQDVSAD